MPDTHTGAEGQHEPSWYEIRIKGHLESRWAGWFEGLIITREDNGDTLLSGEVVDQAALYGVLRRVRDLGLPLIALMQVDPKQASGPPTNADTEHSQSTKETNP